MIFLTAQTSGCGFLMGITHFLANHVLPISYQPYPLPAGSQFTLGKTQMGVARVRPIWVTTALDRI
jgi:hypothetical protein